MADGNGNGQVDVKKAGAGMTLGDIMDYPVKWPGSEFAQFPKTGYGLCDDELWASRQGAEGWRHYQALLTIDVVAGTSVGWAAGAEIKFFGSKGQGETNAPGYPADYELTESETDADREGSMVLDEAELFFIFALGFSVGRPTVLNATDEEAPVQTDPVWLEGYMRDLQEKIPDMFGCSVHWPDTKCEYDLSKMKMWPVAAETVDGVIPAGSNRAGFMGVTGLRRPIFGGYRTTKNLINILAKSGMGYSKLNDAAFPIPALAENTSVVVPISCVVYGVQQRRDRCVLCVGGREMSIDELARRVAEINRGK